MAAGFEADAIDGAIDFRDADDLGDLVGETGALFEVDDFATEALCLGEAFVDHVADDDAGRTEELATDGAGEADRAGASDIDNGAGADARGDGAMEAGGEDVAKQGEIADLGEGLITIGELEEVEVGVGDHDVFGLATDPATHVDVAVGGAGAGGIDIEADARLAGFAILAATAGDVEGDADDVALLDELDIASAFDDFTGDLVTEDEAGGSGGAAADHVLVAATDVGGDDAEDDAVLAGPGDGAGNIEFELGEGNCLDLDFAGSHVDNAAVT